ncbi:MAG: L-histidine N(alpha)-methyltransferase [Gemmatimonadales bacterium]
MTAPSRRPGMRRGPAHGQTRAVGMREEILAGLRARPKKLSPKFFYDAEGARLFEEITALPEYYPTRTELGILERVVDRIAALAGPDVALLEYGSGAGRKVRLLLDALEHPVAYVPIDISGEQLEQVAASLRADYPDIAVHPVRADYTRPLDLPKLPGESRHVAFFPGSTIGNFEPPAATAFLRGVRHTIRDDGALVIGFDRVKDPATLVAAYDDAQGVTARFNRNLLVRLNRELGADFRVEHFAHEARWNPTDSRIEMHLVSLGDQVVTVAGMAIPFAQGETIWTESSYKYDRAMVGHLATSAGFTVRELWSDDDERFWVAMLE